MVPDPSMTSTDRGIPADPERRLWFDYLRSLNDRDIQSKRASGLTTWGLLVLAAGAMYKCLLHLPLLLSSRGSFERSCILFLLETDAIVYLACSLAMLVMFCSGGLTRRILPTSQKRIVLLLGLGFALFGVLISAIHLYAGAAYSMLPQFRWTIQGLGAWWAILIIIDIATRLRRRSRARRYKIPVLTLEGPFAPGDPRYALAAALPFLMGLWAFLEFLGYLSWLERNSPEWLESLRAASYTLVFVAIVCVLLVAALVSASKSTYSILERDLVLEGLAPREIRSRFIEQALGQDVADWLKGVEKTLRESDEKMKELSGTIESRCKEIEQVQADYELERTGRAQRALETARGTIEEQSATLDRAVFQVEEFLKMQPTRQERQLLQPTLAQVRASLEMQKAKTFSIAESLAKLEKLAKTSS